MKIHYNPMKFSLLKLCRENAKFKALVYKPPHTNTKAIYKRPENWNSLYYHPKINKVKIKWLQTFCSKHYCIRDFNVCQEFLLIFSVLKL